MEAKLRKLKEWLDQEVSKRDHRLELSDERPDPLLVARRYKRDDIALICALFSYGNAKLIVKFLNSLDFSLLDQDEAVIRKSLAKHYYRFQKSEDVIAIFIAIKRLREKDVLLQDIFTNAYKEKHWVMDGVNALIESIYELYPHDTQGYKFLLGSRIENINKAGAFKRWHMFLRWMVRKDKLDLGLWQNIDKKDLIIPLDTHTFNVSRNLGLLKRKQYDLKAAIELTETLKIFDSNDPVRYDFALYRIGQENILSVD